MPAVGTIDELNELLEAWDDADDRRRIGNRAASVGHDWAFERQLLRPLPADPFDTALTLTPRVDRYAQVMVRCNQYSVPARFIGHRVRVIQRIARQDVRLCRPWRGRRPGRAVRSPQSSRPRCQTRHSAVGQIVQRRSRASRYSVGSRKSSQPSRRPVDVLPAHQTGKGSSESRVGSASEVGPS
jgi:hypothetical protein